MTVPDVGGPARFRLRLFRRCTVVLPTIWGWVFIFLSFAVALRWLAPVPYDLLTAGSPVPDADFILVEGWLSDEDLNALLQSPHLGAHTMILTAGGPIEFGVRLTSHPDYATLTRDRLIAAGVPEDRIRAIPAERTRRDRTYAAAAAVRAFWEREIGRPAVVNLVTRGVHARRSAMIYRHVLGPEVILGVIVLPEEFGRHEWWGSSQGFRAVLYELLACAYTRISLVAKPGHSP